MSLTNNEKRQISPTHPGVMRREDFMPDYDLTTKNFGTCADGLLSLSRLWSSHVLECKVPLPVGLRRQGNPALQSALRNVFFRLHRAKFFGNSPRFWLNAQQAFDLWNDEKSNMAELEQIKPMNAGPSWV